MLLSVPVFGQVSAERLAQKNIQKGKWERAYGQLNKAIGKDSLSIYAAYVLAQYYFAPDNPDFQLDSAYRYTQKALNDFQRATLKQRERLNRFSVDSLTLVQLRQQIDSAAFIRARQINTEKTYVDFLANFSLAAQRARAATLRDEAAYLDALKENTYQAFNDFLTKYPRAERAKDAKNKYEELLFQAKTDDRRLSSYERYLKEYPNTAYQLTAEQNIFEIRTASGTFESYKTFLDLYAGSQFSKRAKNILFHLTPEDQLEDQFPEYLNDDSLKTVIELERGYIVPFLHSGEFRFMNHHGDEVIKAEADEINHAYRCGNIVEDVIVLPQKIVALNGALICNRAVDSFKDIGYGFISIKEDSCTSVLHKTGFKVGDACIEDAKVLNGKFLALRKDKLWSVWTFTGRMLMPYDWEDIAAIKNVIVFKRNNKCALATVQTIALLADQQDPGLQYSVDEVSVWRNDFIWVKTGDHQGVLDQSLDTLIKVEKHVLSPAYFGSTGTTSEGTQTFNDAGEASIYFQQVVIQQPWTAVRTNLAWHLFDPGTKNYQSPGYDSISFAGPFALALRKDSIRVYFSETKFVDVGQPVRTEFVPGQDSSSFLLLEQNEKKSIYTLTGQKLFTGTYDRIQYAGEGLFVVQVKERKGLITAEGKPLLPLAFDAIGTVNKGVVSLLKATKFGLFDCGRQKLIKPQYNKNLTCYNNNIIIAYKDGLYGFIGWDNKPISKIEFNEVRYWNDSAAFVRKNSQWMIYEVKTQKILLDQIKEYKLIQDSEEKLAIVQQEHNYGVIHNRKGTIIPISFSDIVNVGSRDVPLYFTEKHVEEASIFVVIYYDLGGNMLRKEVYEQDDYEKIYCSDN